MTRRLLTVSFFLAIACLPGLEKGFAATTTPPASVVSFPTGGSALHGLTTTVTGTAQSYSGSGLQKVEVSINGSAWLTAAGTASWSFAWALPADGVYTIRSRATDILNNVETPGAGIAVIVDNCGSPELQHYNWDPSISGQGCNACHGTVSKFLPSGYDKLTGFCITCHSPAGIGHDEQVSGHQHPVMVNVSTGWTRRPTYGNVTASLDDNRAFARLKDGRLIVCVTCHNTMNKYEDFGRAWEFTTTADSKTYYLEKGGWSFMGSLKPNVYRSSSLWSGPTYSKDRKGYIVDPSEYTYDETAGTITFASSQQATTYIYVTLDYPYLRVSSRNNAICLDCHMEGTHKGVNCLVCHQAHNTSNLSGIREVIRTTDRSERAVKFLNITRTNSLADGNSTHDGLCEVCHTMTLYYRRDGSGSSTHADGKNYSGKDCTKCHNHLYGFATSQPAATPVAVVSLIPSASGATSGSTVAWTAAATGGAGGLMYQFWRSGPDTGGSFVLTQNWGASNEYFWMTAAAMAGGNTVKVNVKDAYANTATQSAAYTLVASSSLTSYYGTGLSTDSLNNVCVLGGMTVSYRIRANHTGSLQWIRQYFIGGSGYASGTGGTLYVEIRTDDGSASHLPSGTVLASASVTNLPTLTNSKSAFPLITLSPPVQLQAGQLYHVVWRNIDPYPNTNYTSLDELFKSQPTTPMQPTMSDTDFAVLVNKGSGYSVDNRMTPIIELDYTDGFSGGLGYMEPEMQQLKAVSGTAAAREAFTVSGSNRNVNSVSIYMARRSGSSPVTLRLEASDGTLIDQSTIPASNWVNTSPTSPDGRSPYTYRWGTANFSSSHTLVAGQTYHLVVTSPLDTVYEIYPVRKGSGYGFRSGTYYHDGDAQFNSGNGTGWHDWTDWDGTTYVTDRDLQFYFKGTGSTPMW